MTLSEEVIKAAARDERVVCFRYFKDGGVGRFVTLSPYATDGGGVLGFDHDREAMRRYRFDKMEGGVEMDASEDYVQPHD